MSCGRCEGLPEVGASQPTDSCSTGDLPRRGSEQILSTLQRSSCHEVHTTDCPITKNGVSLLVALPYFVVLIQDVDHGNRCVIAQCFKHLRVGADSILVLALFDEGCQVGIAEPDKREQIGIEEFQAF